MICRTIRPRSELFRFVRTPGGDVEIDLTSKLSGRGAHLCRKSSCIEEGFRKGRLARGLRAELDPQNAGLLKKRAVEYLLSNGEWS